MIYRWKTSLRSLEPKGKYHKAEVLHPEVSGEMSLLLIAVQILLDPVVFTGMKHSLVFPWQNVLFKTSLYGAGFFCFIYFHCFVSFHSHLI